MNIQQIALEAQRRMHLRNHAFSKFENHIENCSTCYLQSEGEVLLHGCDVGKVLATRSVNMHRMVKRGGL